MDRKLLKLLKETEGEEGLKKIAQEACGDKPEQIPDFMKMLNALVSGGSVFEAAGLPKELSEFFYQTALGQYNNGLYVQAGRIFTFLHYIDPDRFDYAFGRACALHQQKKYDLAMICYSIASSLEPKNPKPYYHMADCWEQMGKPFSAYQSFLTAYQLVAFKTDAKGKTPFADNISNEMERLEKKMGITKEFKEKAAKRTEELFAKFKDVEAGKMDLSELTLLLVKHRLELDKEIEANMQNKTKAGG